MIIVERKWKEDDPRGGGQIEKVERKVFYDSDNEAVEQFINETSPVPGYEWHDVKYTFTKI